MDKKTLNLADLEQIMTEKHTYSKTVEGYHVALDYYSSQNELSVSINNRIIMDTSEPVKAQMLYNRIDEDSIPCFIDIMNTNYKFIEQATHTRTLSVFRAIRDHYINGGGARILLEQRLYDFKIDPSYAQWLCDVFDREKLITNP